MAGEELTVEECVVQLGLGYVVSWPVVKGALLPEEG